MNMNKVNKICTLTELQVLLQYIIVESEDEIKCGGTPRIDVLNCILKIAKNEDKSQEFLFSVLTFVYQEVKKNIKMTTATQLDLIGDINKIALNECGRNFVKLQHNFA